jgi:high-affinity Fe2+/Pb2+ permease
MNWLLMNILMGVGMVAIAAGLPAWVLWKFPEGDHTAAQTAAPQASDRTAPAGRNIYQQAAERYAQTTA